MFASSPLPNEKRGNVYKISQFVKKRHGVECVFVKVHKKTVQILVILPLYCLTNSVIYYTSKVVSGDLGEDSAE